jgi:invasion protein IalB
MLKHTKISSNHKKSKMMWKEMCKSNNKKKCITKQKTLHRQTTKTPLSSDFREQINTKLAFTYTHTQKKKKKML